MPDDYELEGSDYGDGGGANFVGHPCDTFWDSRDFTNDDGTTRTSVSLHMKLERANQELTPAAKPYIDWSWNCGPGWSFDGDAIVHTDPEKRINANTDLGKLFAAVRGIDALAGLPVRSNPQSAKAWLSLPVCEWTWTEEAKNVRQPDGTYKKQQQYVPGPGGGLVENPDWKPKRIMVPVSVVGAAPADTEPFDIASLNLTDEALAALTDAAVISSNVDEMMNALHAAGALKLPGVLPAVNNKEQGERVRVALGGTF